MRCGPFTGERYATTLRWVEAGGVEYLRMIGFVIRDRAWRTLPPDAASVRERLLEGGRWTVRARTQAGQGALAWRLDIAPRAHGIDVCLRMAAERDVVVNRAGLVALLPAATFAGARFVAWHDDGTLTRGRLPRGIAPHQPMLGLSRARIAAAGGPAMVLAFEGDTFEMEDQRNWLDPSFKLYSRRLQRPVPYRIRDGAQIGQRISIDLLDPKAPRRTWDVAVPRRGRIPAIGIATSPDRVPRAAPIVTALREIAPDFVLHRTDAKGRGVSRAGALAALLGADLRIEAFGEGAPLAAALLKANATTAACHLSSGGIVKMLRTHAPATLITGGTFADFVKLNRDGVARDAQRVMFALCPTVHASDDRSLLETLDALPLVFAEARRIAAGRPVDAGPCALRRRLVPGTGRPADRPHSPRGVPYDVDARQGDPIAAAWLAVVIAIAGATGIDSVCAFEAAGARGLVGADDAFPSPARMAFGRRTPAHAVLAALGRARRASLILYALRATGGAAFAIGGEGSELWLVDLSGRARGIPRAAAALGRFSRLDTRGRDASWAPTNLQQRLGAYGIVRIALAQPSSRALGAIASAWCDNRTGDA